MSLSNLTVQKLIRAVLVALTMLVPGTGAAQSEYDRHVVFDNNLPDQERLDLR